jgi:hypothetical protein
LNTLTLKPNDKEVNMLTHAELDAELEAYFASASVPVTKAQTWTWIDKAVACDDLKYITSFLSLEDLIYIRSLPSMRRQDAEVARLQHAHNIAPRAPSRTHGFNC